MYVINMSHQPPSSPSMPIYQHRHLSKCRSRLAKELTEGKQAEREEQKTSGKLHNEEESWVRDRGGGKDAWKRRLVVGSDLIIYAAGSRGLPLRFTAFRKQEQIESGSRMCSLDLRSGSRIARQKDLPLANRDFRSYCTASTTNSRHFESDSKAKVSFLRVGNARPREGTKYQ